MFPPARWRHVPVVIVVVGLLAGVAIPAVNSSHDWFGVPPLILWSLVGVALLTPALAVAEFTGRSIERTHDDAEDRR